VYVRYDSMASKKSGISIPALSLKDELLDLSEFVSVSVEQG